MASKDAALEKQKQLAAAMFRLKRMEVNDCFDPVNPDSRPTPAQQEVLNDIGKVSFRYVTAGNQSGKTQMAARELAWVLTGTHPTWKRPAEWGEEPLLLLAVGRMMKHCEEVLWRKIKAFLEPTEYKEVRTGAQLQKVIHEPTGNAILFLSHHSEREAREKLQAFVAHYAWIDEMPGSYKLLEELEKRVLAKRAPFLATFTPKDVNIEIRRKVDGLQYPHGKKYQFAMLDNPVYTKADKEKIISSMSTAPEAYRNTVLYGDWSQGENKVYYFDYDTMVAAPPSHYSPAWRHVEGSDPALKSKFGFTLAAEDPITGKWYLVKDEYIEGVYIPDDMVRVIQEKTAGYNIVRRICDYAPWYTGTASRAGLSYITPHDKNHRKDELIKGLQASLGTRLWLAPWCENAIEELTSAQWSETAESKIINSSSFHVTDSLQYMVDNLPKYEAIQVPDPWHTALLKANAERQRLEAMQAARGTKAEPRAQLGIKVRKSYRRGW